MEPFHVMVCIFSRNALMNYFFWITNKNKQKNKNRIHTFWLLPLSLKYFVRILMENLGKKEHWKKGKYTIINYMYYMHVFNKLTSIFHGLLSYRP